MEFFRSVNISNQKDFACQASRGKQPFPHETWCTVPPLQSRNQDPLCGHAPHTPSLVPSSLCLFEALCKGFDFFFPLLFYFLTSHFFSAQRSFLSSSAQILIVGKKGQTMGTLFLLLLSTSTFPLLAHHSSHPPFYSKVHILIILLFKSPSTTT